MTPTLDGRFARLDTAEFAQAWRVQSEGAPRLARLDAHYRAFEARPAGFTHEGTFFFGDVIRVHGFPEAGLVTLLTKGLSGFDVRSPNGHGKIGVELAWTLRDECLCDAATAALVRMADLMLARREGFHHNELVPFDFSGLPVSNRLVAFLVAHEFWLEPGVAMIAGETSTYIMELFALKDDEARLAGEDIDRFSEAMAAAGAEPEDLARG